MAKVEPTTIAIAAVAAYFLLRPKDANAAGTDSDGGCAPGFVPGLGGLCVPITGAAGLQGVPVPTPNPPPAIDPQIAPLPGDPDEPMGPGDFATVPGPGGVPDVSYEPINMAVWKKNTPTARHFYQVRSGDYLNKIARTALKGRVLLELESRVPLMPAAEKNAIADKITNSAFKAYRELIVCSPWNDMLYGTYGTGAQAYKGPNGRGFRLIPKHADNLKRLIEGDEPIRNLEWGVPNGPKAQPVNTGAGFNKYELLWLPGISGSELVTPDLEFGSVVTPQWLGWEWSEIVPPRAVWDRSFITYADDNDPNVYGCVGYEQGGY